MSVECAVLLSGKVLSFFFVFISLIVINECHHIEWLIQGVFSCLLHMNFQTYTDASAGLVIKVVQAASVNSRVK